MNGKLLLLTMKHNSFTLLYFITGLLFIMLEGLNAFIPSLVVRSLLMPMLILFYHSHIRGKYNTVHRLIMAGLFFAWAGDISLQIANDRQFFILYSEYMFLIGLGSYLITQVLYIVAFNIPWGNHTVLSTRIYHTLLVLSYGLLLIWFLYRSLGDMKVPVILYAFVILLMLLSALNRYGKASGISYIIVVIGAILFVISDSMVAINKFHFKFQFARTLIMITYLTAQYLIVLGCLKQDILVRKESDDHTTP